MEDKQMLKCYVFGNFPLRKGLSGYISIESYVENENIDKNGSIK